MQKIASGDAVSFNELYSLYSSRIHGFVKSRVSNKEIAKEIHQTVWTKISRKAHTFDPDKRFHPWIMQVANNCINDAFRKQQRLELQSSAFRNKKSGLHRAFSYQILEESSDRIDLTGLPFDKLPRRYKDIMKLYYWGSMEPKRIAETMGISYDNVRQILSRGRKKLKALVLKKAPQAS